MVHRLGRLIKIEEFIPLTWKIFIDTSLNRTERNSAVFRTPAYLKHPNLHLFSSTLKIISPQRRIIKIQTWDRINRGFL